MRWKQPGTVDVNVNEFYTLEELLYVISLGGQEEHRRTWGDLCSSTKYSLTKSRREETSERVNVYRCSLESDSAALLFCYTRSSDDLLLASVKAVHLVFASQTFVPLLALRPIAREQFSYSGCRRRHPQWLAALQLGCVVQRVSANCTLASLKPPPPSVILSPCRLLQ
jgi:hypothetical protein